MYPEDIRPVSPIGLVRIGSQASEVGIGNIVFILAVVNVTLALFNSVPLYRAGRRALRRGALREDHGPAG